MMPIILYSPVFQKEFKKLPDILRQIAKKRLALFLQNPFHSSLRSHKLEGKLQGLFAFSIDYDHRVLFEIVAQNTIRLLRIGNHSLYRKKKK